MTIDITFAAEQIAKLSQAISEDDFLNPTPCEGLTVGDLLDHMMGLSLAFTWAAEKSTPSNAGSATFDAGNLGTNWRRELTQRVTALADAWNKPSAWEGMSEAGGVTMPSEIMGVVALDELVIHGWDIAKGVGADFVVAPDHQQAIFEFTKAAAEPSEVDLRDGIFGPPFEVAEDAPLFDRALGYSGRNPQWRASDA